MKKLLLLLSVSLLFTMQLLACSNPPRTFCQTTASFSEDLIVSGKITSIDDDGINLEIIDILRGEESKTTIRIWDGVDFDCNGNHPMNAALLGDLNDTIIIILPKITEKASDWEVIGDYRRPTYFGYTPSLKVENEIVSGFIYSDRIIPENDIKSYDYDDFVSNWLQNNSCTAIKLSTDNINAIDNILKYNTIVTNNLKIELNNELNSKIIVYNTQGIKLKEYNFIKNEINIDFIDYSSGFYFVHIKLENSKLKIIKVLKE